MKISVSVKDDKNVEVHSVAFTITKEQFEVFKQYLQILKLKFRKAAADYD